MLLVVPGARAWTWPADGPVVRPFSLGPDPYAGGQHRGIDVGGAPGASVRAPAGGTVSFVGTVPGGGLTVAIRTADDYSVTLLHLGSVAVHRGDSIAEGSVVGTVGPSGTPDVDVPYVYMGVRVASQPEGYVDPLSLLPARPVAAAPPEASQPAPAPSEPAATPAPPAAQPPAAATPEPPSEPAAPAAGPAPEPSARPTAAPAPTHAAPTPDEHSAPVAAPATAPAPAVQSGADHDSSVQVDQPTAAAPAQPAAAEPAPATSDATADDASVSTPSTTAPVPTVGETKSASRVNDPGIRAGGRPKSRAVASEPVRVHPSAAQARPSRPQVHAARAASLVTARVSKPARRKASEPRVSRGAHAAQPALAAVASIAQAASTPTVREKRELPEVASPVDPNVGGRHGHTPVLVVLLAALATILVALIAAAAWVAGVPARIMCGFDRATVEEVASDDESAEDPGCSGLAVRERPAPHRPRRGLRRPVRHLRALPPAEGQRRADGERHRRARHSGDGGRRPRRGVAA
jgi:hypothetical protein